MVVHLEHLIPVAEAAYQAGISRERLVRLIQRGRILGQRIAGRWFAERTSVAEFVKGLSQGVGNSGSHESGATGSPGIQ